MYDLADGILVEYAYLTMKVVNVLVEEVLPRGGGWGLMGCLRRRSSMFRLVFK